MQQILLQGILLFHQLEICFVYFWGVVQQLRGAGQNFRHLFFMLFRCFHLLWFAPRHERVRARKPILFRAAVAGNFHGTLRCFPACGAQFVRFLRICRLSASAAYSRPSQHVTRHDAFLPQPGLHVPAAAGKAVHALCASGGSVPPLASYADAEGVQQVCSSLAVPVVVFFLLRAFLFPFLHCLQPLFFETFRTLHPSRGRISAAASWTYPVRFVPLIFRHGLFHLLRRTLHFSGLVTGAPSARLHYGGARWPRLFFLFFAPGKELIAVIPVFK